MYSHYLTPMGRSEESVREARPALDLDPLDVLLNVHLGWAYLHSRRLDEAIAQSLKAVAMDPQPRNGAHGFRARLSGEEDAR
jgi:Flp pilus assembly protein TadD